MSYNELQDDYSASFDYDSDKVLSTIQKLGSKFVSPAIDHPNECNRDKRAIRGVRKAARNYLTEHKLNPLAVWKVFEATYGDELTINSWSREMFLGDNRDEWAKTTVAKLFNRLEDALNLALLPPKDFLERRLEAMLDIQQFNPVERVRPPLDLIKK